MSGLFASPYPLLVPELARSAAPWLPFGLPDGQWTRVGSLTYSGLPPWEHPYAVLLTGRGRPVRTKRSR